MGATPRPESRRGLARSGRLSRGCRRQFAALLEYPVDQPVLHRLAPVHEAVAISILLDALDALPGVLGEDLVEPVTRLEHFPGVDLHVRGLALKAAERLVDHDAHVRQAIALAARAAGEQHRTHA